MAAHLDFRAFAKECQDAERVDVAAMKKRQQECEARFKHIIFDVTDTKEVSDVSLGELLTMVDLAEYYFGGEAPWVKTISDTQKKLAAARMLARRRVL